MSNKLFKPTKRLQLSITGVVLEGIISGCNFMVLFKVLELIFGKTIFFGDILRATGCLGIIFVLRLILYSVSYTESQIGGAGVSENLRVGIGDKLRRIPLGNFTKKRMGYYMNAATNEVADYEQILTHKLADIIKFCVLIVVLALYVSLKNMYIGFIMFASLLLLIPALKLSFHLVNKYGTTKNLAREETVSAISEYLLGSQTLRSYGMAGKKNIALRNTMKEFSNVSYQYERALIPVGFAFMFCVYVGAAASIYIAVNAMVLQELSAAELIVIIMLSLFSCKVEASLYVSIVAYRNLLISKSKIAKLFDEKEEEKGSGSYAPETFKISFENVNFSYVKGERVLTNLSFEIPENKITAIVGESGSGKTTIFNLLSKYYEADSGTILIDHEDISKADVETVLSNISLVDQDVFLFNDTIRNNLRFAAPTATDEEIINACQKANCNFIEYLPEGINTVVGENGNKLSGGERQRLSIARAILRNSNIVLLDEATASLDIENELLVKKAVQHLLELGKTVVMIAHTLPIVQSADQILVIDHGTVIEYGSHEELLVKNGKYTAMWNASKLTK
ncbi:ABC transporter ATP-binding protein [Lachnospira pectinoschiza]|uniref:ATP-binding cassette, subfamily B n=1 Tax=Lachnospira pectinoschiza TaxID=28052 RepID=A0A1G9YVG9_9FIRM|nr:ABC transporter ATP-binding protein [Lachnospira pectinoschiza]SDN12353.1 ATP-binding cassette, subfamily B [Lachnospira pectinoschiza]